MGRIGDGYGSEVVREELSLVKEQDEIRRIHLEELCKEIAFGTEQLERGEVTVYAFGQEVAAKIKAEGRKRLHVTPKS